MLAISVRWASEKAAAAMFGVGVTIFNGGGVGSKLAGIIFILSISTR